MATSTTHVAVGGRRLFVKISKGGIVYGNSVKMGVIYKLPKAPGHGRRWQAYANDPAEGDVLLGNYYTRLKAAEDIVTYYVGKREGHS